jgi:D-alanyl-D-alanine carboxypeptidase (penicillin-binding protein 5/6)
VFKTLAAGKISMDDRVLVSEKAWRTGGSRMFIEVGTEVSVEDLLHGMIIQSGNDASIALAEHVAGSEEAFVGLMNEYAASLGMTATSFRNSTGLPAKEHLSTARDLAILARALVEEFPGYYALYSEREYTYNMITQHNRNVLLWRDDSVDGMKTGHTNAAGYCLVSSAERSGMRLIAVVLGAESPEVRADAGLTLIDYGFEHFETHKLYARGEPVSEARVWKGEPATASLGLAEDLYVTVPRGQYEGLSATMELDGDLVAPVERAAQVGEVRVAFRGQVLETLPLVVLQAVPEADLWTRLTDGVKLWLE